MIFSSHKLIQANNMNTLVLYLNPRLTEFARDFEDYQDTQKKSTIRQNINNYIKEKLPNTKIDIIKIMIGPMLLTVFTFGMLLTDESNPTVTKAYASQAIEYANRIFINGAPYNFSKPAMIINGTTYVPVREIAEALGAEVWWNGETGTVGINKGNTKIAFVVGSNTARVNNNKIFMQPSFIDNDKTMVPLRFISEALGMAVTWNADTRDISISSQPSDSINESESNTVSYNSYTIKSGDTIWDLSIQFGVTMSELLEVNNLTMNSILYVGQKIKVPVHKIPVKEPVSEKYGEYLDWWTEAQYVFPIGKVATVTDFKTGKSFKVKRTIGAFHADCEPLTAEDAAIIKEIWGGTYSWKERAVIVNVDGRRIAASMASMPHDIEYITDNNFNGHFDIHFKNSTRHKDGLISENHQKQIKVAAGLL